MYRSYLARIRGHPLDEAKGLATASLSSLRLIYLGPRQSRFGRF